MITKTDWPVMPLKIEGNEAEFFSPHQWNTIEAATARIYPTDKDPGAREANVVRYIDRYISGIDYIFASGDGSGFLKMSGKLADAWRARIARLQANYKQGIEQLDALSQDSFGKNFVDLGEKQQDDILALMSGQPKPEPVVLSQTSPLSSALQGVGDDGMGFFEALCLHTRQGMFCDPVYGGNENRVGWDLVGFPGPKSLKDTLDMTYSIKEYFVHDVPWEDLVPHYAEHKS
ncbi:MULTISPECIES: gluconate 2-dehydrogenase subunit 3 family protein [Mameliella]|uniref:Gluconate 2-dehydrogenase, membrane-bound, gamma subunit n=1 Tax=Mameliella alba TaxID=561184 RepID=A0A0B3RTN8_9RHOB|nr:MULTISPECIES: gluconate 2-dehydrogenase subunit 3 family protein [Mameliella]KHQ50133.1 Gluconate 2-dehydrogenase, membrane-bound, gamma subunit [Mameliella alba]